MAGNGRRRGAKRTARPGRRSGRASRGECLAAVRRLAAACPEHAAHARHVAGLALELFDRLRPLHGLGPEQRFLLRCAALLHDVGWAGGRKGHHKAALRAVLDSPLLPFGRRDRLVIGSVARYHRRALPARRHAHFAELGRPDRRIVRALSALLRVADGLDRSQRGAVRGLSCRVGPGQVNLALRASGDVCPERSAALKKSDLFEKVFGRELRFSTGRGRGKA